MRKGILQRRHTSSAGSHRGAGQYASAGHRREGADTVPSSGQLDENVFGENRGSGGAATRGFGDGAGGYMTHQEGAQQQLTGSS